LLLVHRNHRRKRRLGLNGLARATTKIGLANLVYNMKRMIWLAAQTVPV
jgi:hypothetical protein